MGSSSKKAASTTTTQRWWLHIMARRIHTPLLTRVVLVLVACCMARFAWTTITNKYHVEVKIIVRQKPDPNNNTHWKNVQYHRGVFGQRPSYLSQADEQHISNQCIRISGHGHLYDNAIKNNNTCWGPLPTNITCCYCYISHDYQSLTTIASGYQHWACAMARPNALKSLSSSSSPRVSLPKGKRIAWITGQFQEQAQEQVTKMCQQVQAMKLFHLPDVYCVWKAPSNVTHHKQFRRHFQHSEGAQWIHRALLLRQTMDLYNEGDYLVYTDADRIDFFELGSFHGVLETMLTNELDDLSIDLEGNSNEIGYTKEDVLAAFDANTTMRESPQVRVQVVVIRNSPPMKRFMDAWVECVADWHMVSDEASVLSNSERFAGHRHDQSILSLLIKTFMTTQHVVGPPARPFSFLCQYVTYKLKEQYYKGGGDVSLTTFPPLMCPFKKFYASRFVAHHNMTMSRTH